MFLWPREPSPKQLAWISADDARAWARETIELSAPSEPASAAEDVVIVTTNLGRFTVAQLRNIVLQATTGSKLLLLLPLKQSESEARGDVPRKWRSLQALVDPRRRRVAALLARVGVDAKDRPCEAAAYVLVPEYGDAVAVAVAAGPDDGSGAASTEPDADGGALDPFGDTAAVWDPAAEGFGPFDLPPMLPMPRTPFALPPIADDDHGGNENGGVRAPTAATASAVSVDHAALAAALADTVGRAVADALARAAPPAAAADPAPLAAVLARLDAIEAAIAALTDAARSAGVSATQQEQQPSPQQQLARGVETSARATAAASQTTSASLRFAIPPPPPGPPPSQQQQQPPAPKREGDHCFGF
ncbi:hypothetical protein HK405_004473 [Cladochytrium tenue]|nr:hypothetical protein HK405_004473 [Cladochytrium tenue]